MITATCTLSLRSLEPRLVPSARLVEIAPVDPFAGNTSDNPSTQPGVNYPRSQVEPFVAVIPARPNNLVGA